MAKTFTLSASLTEKYIGLLTGRLVDLFSSSKSGFEMETRVKEEHASGARTPDMVRQRPRSKSAFVISAEHRPSPEFGAGVRGESPVKPGLFNRWSEGSQSISFPSTNSVEESGDLTETKKQRPPTLRVTTAEAAVSSDAQETDEAPSSPQPSQTRESLEVPLTRSKSIPKAIFDVFSKLEVKNQSTRDKQFHRLFENIPQEEKLIKSYPCALVRDVLLQGRMFISVNWICFSANILGFETKVVIPVDNIRSMNKMKYTLLVPKAVSIHTDTNKYVFGSLLSRRATYKKLMEVWNGKPSNNDTDKSVASQDGSYSQDSFETSLTDDQVFEDDVDGLDRSQQFPSESRKKNSGRPHRVKDDSTHDEMQNTSGVGWFTFQSFEVQVKRLGKSVRAKHLVVPLALLVICCLCVSSCVLACRIARVQDQLQKLPHVAEALEWNRLLVTSHSGHMEQVSKLRDSLVLSLQILNKMHSALQLMRPANNQPTATKE